jgi:hypothetical protein
MLVNKSMRMIALVLFSAIFFSCEDPKGIGLPLGGGDYATTFTDTLTINTATVLLDSTVAEGNNYVTVGSVDDLVFGKTTAKAYWQVSLPINTNIQTGAVTYADFKVEDDAEYDSTYFYFAWSRFIQGDTTKPFTLSLHRLAESFDKNKRYQHNDKLAIEPTPILTRTFTYQDMKRSTVANAPRDSLLKFKLPDNLGRELFALSGKYTTNDNDKFMTDYKGYALVSNSTSTIYGIALDNSNISAATNLFLYYHKKGETARKLVVFSNRNKKFSEIISDRRGTETERFKDKSTAFSSKLTNGKTYFQSGTGITTKFEIPYLSKLVSKGRVAINKAELVITPDENTTGIFLPPNLVSLVQIDDKNKLIYKSGSLQSVPIDGASGSGGLT